MGLILDSSVIVAAERRGDTAEQFLERVVNATGDQDAALSAVGLTDSSTASIAQTLPPFAFAVKRS